MLAVAAGFPAKVAGCPAKESCYQKSACQEHLQLLWLCYALVMMWIQEGNEAAENGCVGVRVCMASSLFVSAGYPAEELAREVLEIASQRDLTVRVA
jgi:hypothetical protein